MYSTQESALLKQAFWTALGQYLKPIPSYFSPKVNWLNYHTGMKHVFFRLQATKNQASITIQITHPQPAIKDRIFLQFQQLKPMLESETQECWVWNKNDVQEDGHTIGSIGISLHGVNVMNRSDWPAIISFFKARILALDKFWAEAKEIVELPLD